MITETVKTVETDTKVIDIINEIAKKKYNAIRKFLKGESFNEVVIFGVYLWGNYVAQKLSETSKIVYVVDIHEFLERFITYNDNIKFLHLKDFKLKFLKNEINPDLVIDLTGIGGLDPEFLSKFRPIKVVIEDPKGVFDEEIYKVDKTYNKILQLSIDCDVGILKTYRKAKVSKTSGTMTLTIDTIVDASREVNALDGVLYVIPNLRYYEEILFKEKNVTKFLEEISKPALTISCLDENIKEEAEKILKKNIDIIYSFVEEY
ncbi:SAM-dependent methyltransferase HcgC family protein [Methanocaldococcus indicus]|uniref:SAM-dependent methyltransferase HcgC family protein n=1 Tax=Methanocaldococcus indicus TaxID=213231 RepID=UPI003C6D4F85